jgi:putative Mn2+ efflux pump MntP
VTSVYALLTGIAFGFLGTGIPLMLVTVVCVTVAVVIAGMYTGYHLGFQHKTKAYFAGAALLWIAGIDVIVRHILR